MMNVSSWSIRNPIPAVMLFVLLTFGGVLSFNKMKVQNFPDIDLPTVLVSASLPGASPSQLETDVARKLENSLATVQGLKHLYTKVQDGVVTVTAEFRLEKPVQEAVDDVRSAVARVRADMPADLRDPVINKLELAGQPVLAFTIASRSMDVEGLSWFVDNEISRKLLAVPGVGAVNRVGGVDREVRVALDSMKLQSLGVSAADISRQLRQTQIESAGGKTDLGGGEQPVRTLATVKTAGEVGEIDVAVSGGRHVKLRDVAEVTDTYADPPASAALLNGKPVVGFEVARSRGESEVTVGALVHKALAELKAQRPDIELTQAFDFVTPVEEEYDGSLHLLYEGAALAVLVVWLFLRDWRATFVSAVALPMSVIPAFIGMYLLGFSVNVVTLLALSLVIGILVDDAIVEVENIVRHLRMGKTPYEAAMEAADEIGLAVIATTFTLIAVFLPTAFMSGVAGKFFKQFGWTAALAVFASLVVARVLTPMMAAYLLKPAPHEYREPGWLRVYMRWVRWSMSHRLMTMVLATVFFFASVALIPLLPTGFLPPDDNSQTQVYLELPPGSTLDQTRNAAEQARLAVLKVKNVESVYTTIGGGAAGTDPFANAGAAEARKATLTILLAPRGERPRKQVIENQIRTALEVLPGVRTKVGLGGSGEKYILVLTGEDPQALAGAALAVEKDLRTIPGLGQIASTASLIRPEIAVRPDFAKMADLGVTSQAIADTLRIATSGDYDVSLPKLNLSQRQVPIVVKLQESARKDLGVLQRLTVPGAHGPVMLAEVASLEAHGRPGGDRPLRPLAQRQLRDRAVRPAAGRRQGQGAGAASDPQPAPGREGGGSGRCRSDGRTVRELRPGHAHRRAVHLHRAGAPVQGLPASGDHLERPAAGAGRGLRRPAGRAQEFLDAFADRPGHADGDRDQELDPAGGVRHRGAPRPGHGPLRRAARRLPQAGAAHHHDHHRHGRRHAADRAGPGRRRLQLPLADGDRGDRRAVHVHGAEPAGGTGGVRGRRRRRTFVAQAGGSVLRHA